MGEMLGGRGVHERGPQAAAQRTSRCWALEQLCSSSLPCATCPTRRISLPHGSDLRVFSCGNGCPIVSLSHVSPSQRFWCMGHRGQAPHVSGFQQGQVIPTRVPSGFPSWTQAEQQVLTGPPGSVQGQEWALPLPGSRSFHSHLCPTWDPGCGRQHRASPAVPANPCVVIPSPASARTLW